MASEGQATDPGDERSSLFLVVHRSLASIRRDRMLAFLPSAIVASLATILFLGAGLSGDAAFLFGLVGVVLVGAVLVGILGNTSGWILRDAEPGLTADEAGLTLSTATGPARRLPYESLALAWLSRARTMELYAYDGSTHTLSFRKEEEASALVARVRSRQARKSYELSLDGPAHTTFGGALLGLSAYLASMVSLTVLAPLGVIPGVVPPMIFFLLGLRLLFIRRSVRFGADGLVFSSGPRQRFVPYKDVDQVYASAGDGLIAPLYLRLHDGGWLRVPGLRGRRQTEMLASLVGEGVEMHARGEADGAQVADLARREESAMEWRQRLAGLVRGRYRGATLSPEKLATLMRNPAADPDQRAAAAVALLREPGAGTRIRVAAEVSADPRVRAALEELAQVEEGELDDDALEKVIAQVGEK